MTAAIPIIAANDGALLALHLPGDTLSAVVEVLTVQPSASRPDRGTAQLRTTTVNQRGEAVLMMTSVQLVPRRTSEAPQEGRNARH